MLTNNKPDGWDEGRLKVKCKHCGKSCNIVNHKRWHDDNCKFGVKNNV